MEIREAIDDDIPAIVTLLKQSLGESLMPKSEEYWRWKHVDNPFGSSPVLLAIDNSKLVGVRAFMRWRWRKGNDLLEAVRAVDTATHPDYQGKGIFSKLTKASLESCKNNGWHFVFNTPNEKSKPGYLKMGWVEAGKLPLNVRVAKPFNVIQNIVLKRGFDEINDESNLERYFKNPGLQKLISNSTNDLSIVSDHNIQSLTWRYKEVPVALYSGIALDEENLKALLIYRVKTTRAGKEFRIVDFFSESPQYAAGMKDLLQQKVNELKIDYLTSSALATNNLLSKGIHLENLKIGPIVTVRSITMTDLSLFTGFHGWKPSLGDLELF